MGLLDRVWIKAKGFTVSGKRKNPDRGWRILWDARVSQIPPVTTDRSRYLIHAFGSENGFNSPIAPGAIDMKLIPGEP